MLWSVSSSQASKRLSPLLEPKEARQILARAVIISRESLKEIFLITHSGFFVEVLLRPLREKLKKLEPVENYHILYIREYERE